MKPGGCAAMWAGDRDLASRNRNRIGSASRPRFASIAAACVVGIMLVAGCAAPRVESAGRAGVELDRLDPVWVELQSSASSSGVAPDSPLARSLQAEVEAALRARGHRIAARSEARMILVVGLRVESALRRTFSSDPDQGGTRARPREEAVVLLNAFARESGEEVFRAEARSLIPTLEIDALRSRADLWRATLAAALDELDAGSD